MVGKNQEMIDIEGFKKYLWEEELSENTITSYVEALELYAKKYSEITKPNLIQFKGELLTTKKPATVNLRITALLKYCKFKNITMTLKRVKVQKKTYIDNVINIDQFERLKLGLEQDGQSKMYVNIMLLAKTGMRISEAIRIKKKDLYAGKVTIPAKAHMRTIYFPKSLIDDISPYISKYKDDDYLMQNNQGNQITSRGISERLMYFAEKYSIPKEVMYPHSFRHFFAIEFLKRNSNIALLADLLGHQSVNVTQIYLRMSQEQQKDAIDKAVNW